MEDKNTCGFFEFLGRLGNWMFQTASLIGYAKKYDMNYYFPRLYYQNYFKNLEPTCPRFVPRNTIKEIRSVIYSDLPRKDFANLDGYFQSYKYFENLNINKIFEIKEDLLKNNKYFCDIMNSNSCFIHVRRWDWVDGDNYNNYLPVEYYKKAVDVIGVSGNQDDKYFIFSNDVGWCSKNFDFIKNKVFVNGNNDVVDMLLMSYCKNCVISCSTISWWGAFLNNLNLNKKVVCPKNWFQTGCPKRWLRSGVELNYDDIIFQSWIKLDHTI